MASADAFLSGSHAARLGALYHQYLTAPDSLETGWADLFADLDDEARAALAGMNGGGNGAAAPGAVPGAAAGADPIRAAALDSLRALMMIRAYRVRGHLEADLDPLGLKEVESHPELAPASYGFGEADMDRPIFIDNVMGLETATPREIVSLARETYCGHIGVEYMHIQDPAQKAWIQRRIEGSRSRPNLTKEEKVRTLEDITRAEVFEQFLNKKYTGTKRFGLDGGESTMAAMEEILRRGSELGLEEVVVGMPHRGRLNVLANFMGKPFTAIFSEFQGGASHPEDIGGSGDVKYHLGTSTDRSFGGRSIHLSLTANPSHLEAVNPVVVGKVRAKQDTHDGEGRTAVMGLLLHGDAAFAGQGLVAETLDLSELKGYRTGGTIHLVVNNQIGFTTNPVNSRSGPYCSDVAKINQAPIIHVNGDDPEAVILATRMVIEFRQEFHKDAVLDLFCYRRFGHNESDEPAFTQPLMYRRIDQHETTRKLYADQLVREGTLTQAEVDRVLQSWNERLEQDFEAAKGFKVNKADWLEGDWSGLGQVKGYDARRGETEVPLETLREVGAALVRVPEDFNLNRKIARQLDAKRKAIESGENIDWATAEALAFGTLLIEGHPVRLSGQDCNRGTFSQRHAAWTDQENEKRWKPLQHIRDKQGRLEIFDSPLNEMGVLGYEYGYSLAEPNALVLWEAQFGDFANGAQVIIDQFISPGEYKWLRMSGLVMLLPHGYEGQGPEHSSARLERYLQLCAEDNMQVVNCTTPANYFHVLRRQLHRDFRKPLIVMTPKSLLRHKACQSKLADMGPDTTFHRVLYDDDLPSSPQDARQLVLCSGKVYYDLYQERKERGADQVHFLRLEQLYPFPHDALAELMAPYKHCDIVWCQEEPRNMGAWPFASTFIEEVAEMVGFENPRPRYAGRKSASSPATGSFQRHAKEQAALIDDALTLGKKAMTRIQTRIAEENARKEGRPV